MHSIKTYLIGKIIIGISRIFCRFPLSRRNQRHRVLISTRIYTTNLVLSIRHNAVKSGTICLRLAPALPATSCVLNPRVYMPELLIGPDLLTFDFILSVNNAHFA